MAGTWGHIGELIPPGAHRSYLKYFNSVLQTLITLGGILSYHKCLVEADCCRDLLSKDKGH